MVAGFYGSRPTEQRDAERRQQQLQLSRDLYQSQIQRENITNLSLQNEALRTSIEAMRGRGPGRTTVSRSTTYTNRYTGQTTQNLQEALQWPGPPSPGQSGGAGAPAPTPAQSQNNFPSLAQIQSMIESSQKKAQEDFTSKIDLFKTQEQQKQEEEQLSARNAATRMQNYQRQSAIGAWESALRGR